MSQLRLLGRRDVELICLRRVVCIEIALAAVTNTTSRVEKWNRTSEFCSRLCRTRSTSALDVPIPDVVVRKSWSWLPWKCSTIGGVRLVHDSWRARQLSIERRRWLSNITRVGSYHTLQKNVAKSCPRAEARHAALWYFFWTYSRPLPPTHEAVLGLFLLLQNLVCPFSSLGLLSRPLRCLDDPTYDTRSTVQLLNETLYALPGAAGERNPNPEEKKQVSENPDIDQSQPSWA